jgi:hypothetical protein
VTAPPAQFDRVWRTFARPLIHRTTEANSLEHRAFNTNYVVIDLVASARLILRFGSSLFHLARSSMPSGMASRSRAHNTRGALSLLVSKGSLALLDCLADQLILLKLVLAKW